MNYTRPNSDELDEPKDWLNSALIFARTLSLILEENTGIVVKLKGDMVNPINPDSESCISSTCIILSFLKTTTLYDSDSFSIEVGEWLEVYDGSKDYNYYTFEMNGQEWFAERNKFITIQQWREKQLNKLV